MIPTTIEPETAAGEIVVKNTYLKWHWQKFRGRGHEGWQVAQDDQEHTARFLFSKNAPSGCQSYKN